MHNKHSATAQQRKFGRENEKKNANSKYDQRDENLNWITSVQPIHGVSTWALEIFMWCCIVVYPLCSASAAGGDRRIESNFQWTTVLTNVPARVCVCVFARTVICVDWTVESMSGTYAKKKITQMSAVQSRYYRIELLDAVTGALSFAVRI